MPRAPARMLQVSEAARRLGVTPRAVRFYEECHLVSSLRGAAGERLYDEPAFRRLEFVCEARGVGLTVRETRNLLYLGDHVGMAVRDAHLATACLRRLGELDRQRARIVSLIGGDDHAVSPRRASAGG